jgi:hypothetical protein
MALIVGQQQWVFVSALSLIAPNDRWGGPGTSVGEQPAPIFTSARRSHMHGIRDTITRPAPAGDRDCTQPVRPVRQRPVSHPVSEQIT